MKIKRSISSNGTFAPRAINVLDGLPADKLFHVQHGMRHPASVYRLSLEKLGTAFKRVTDAYLQLTEQHLVSTGNDLSINELLDHQEHLLRVQQEHIDDCYLILKSLIDPSKAKDTGRFNDQYVLKNRLPGAKSFEAAIKPSKISLRIANKLRHNQGRLRGVATRPFGRIHLGYFLEEPDANGVLGPSSEIHPTQGAFSFARDIRLRFYDVYFCSEKLSDTVRASFRELHQMDVTEKAVQPVAIWNDLAKTVQNLGENIFPKEAGAFMPKVTISNEGDSLLITSDTKATLAFQSPLSVTVSTVPDAHSPSFKVPLP